MNLTIIYLRRELECGRPHCFLVPSVSLLDDSEAEDYVGHDLWMRCKTHFHKYQRQLIQLLCYQDFFECNVPTRVLCVVLC